MITLLFSEELHKVQGQFRKFKRGSGMEKIIVNNMYLHENAERVVTKYIVVICHKLIY